MSNVQESTHKSINIEDKARTSYGRILKIAIPMVIQGLIFTTMLLADRLFVARYDPIFFAAVGTAGGMATAIAFFFSGTIGFASNIVAQYYGAERKEMLAFPVWAGLSVAAVSALFLVITLPLTQNIFRIEYFRHSEELILSEQLYYRFIVVMHAIGLFQVALSSFFIGIGQTFKTMIVAIVGNLVNIIFDWLLIFGVGGFPELGLMGAGVASVMASIVSVILSIGFYIHASKKYPGILKPKVDFVVLKRLLSLGTPAGLQMGLEMAGFSVLQMALGGISIATLGASSVSFGLQAFVYTPVVAMAGAGAIIIGQERGALRMHNFKPIIRKVLIISNIYSLFMLVVMWAFPEQLTAIYGNTENTSNPEVLAEIQHIARYFLLITGIWLIPDTFFNTYMQVLKALGDSRYLSINIIAATLFIIVIPSLILMQVNAPWAKYAIYSLTILYVIFLWIMFGLRYRSNKWKDNHVID
ncbi:MATE family efflux transporter [Entomospira entomophila]|uniref:Multidrug-efflux transporter n=1 Tax=Entomospira entomophila TaxID=2719988 RepID=A0A968GBS4_9SPIO|nr:MATE family efflux transporter [Entomospira entomophilus]NIZ40466.1 MATE family efflux transporter [Entomospira entomophilus]WDI36024.1 MATE family efflux transporter [Entomospira entomophilus]